MLMLEVRVGDDSWEFDDGHMMVNEAIELQKVTGMTQRELYQRYNTRVDPEALKAIVWLARRRAGEDKLRWSELNFDLVECSITALKTDGEGEQDSDPTEPPKPTRRAPRSKQK